jgi:hypothetical protein
MSFINSNFNNTLLIISEIGLELNIDNIEEEYKKIFSEKVQNKESIIYNNKGDIITNINDIFFAKNEKFFLFNKKYDKELILKMLDDSIKKLISNYDSQLILDKQNLPDIYSNENLLIENSSKLKFIEANDIKITFEKMLEYFENYKNIYTSFKVNSHICEEIKNNYKNINASINILIDNINKISKICEQKQSEAIDENKKLSEIKEINVKKLEEGLDILRKQELHPLLQTNDSKHLIDIYFDVKNMETKKDENLKNEEIIIKFTKEKTAQYINETKKFIKEKGKSIADIQSEMNDLSRDYDNGFNNLINEPNKIHENLMQDFLYFRQSLLIIFEYLNNNNHPDNDNNNISSPQETKSFDDSCEQISILKNKYNDFSTLNQLQTKLEPINQIYSKMRKSFENLALKINKIFNTLYTIYKTIGELSEKFNVIRQQSINLEECFNQLQNPSKFPMAYEQSLDEIKRRIIFNCKIKKYFSIIENLVKNETELRKNFKTKYGIYLPNIPNNFFSCLKNYEPIVKLEINTNDELNKFPKFISEDEINILIENSFDKNIINSSYEGNLLNNNSQNIIIENKMIKELKDELYKKEQRIKNLEHDLEQSCNSYENILQNFSFFLKEKDEEMERINQEKNNLISYCNNKIKNNIEICPLCRETALNNEQIPKIQLIQNKISKLENTINQIYQKYQNLVNNTIAIKKVFFNYMNNKIANYNLNNLQFNSNEINGLNINNALESSGNNLYYNELKANNNRKYISQNDIQIITNLLNEEKLKNNKLTTDKNILITKYESLKTDMKKIQNKYDEVFKQLNSLNEKLIVIQKENMTLKDEIVLKDKKQNNTDNTIIELRQFIKQISDDNNTNENKHIKEIQKIKNKSIIFKDIKEGDKCIFVPYYDKIYVCINLTIDLNQINNDFFRCDIILDFSCIDENKKNLIVDNNLIIIGTISELKEKIIKEGEVNPFEININENNNEEENEEDEFSVISTSINSYLKSTNSYHLAKLSSIDYIIGFPEDKLCFMNYINHSYKK